MPLFSSLFHEVVDDVTNGVGEVSNVIHGRSSHDNDTPPQLPDPNMTPAQKASQQLTLGLLLGGLSLLAILIFAYKWHRWEKYGKASMHARMIEVEARQMELGKVMGGERVVTVDSVVYGPVPAPAAPPPTYR